MITIEHYSAEYPPMVSWLIHDAIPGATRDEMGLYWSGISEPNYPVPAIPRVVTYSPRNEYVAITDCDGYVKMVFYNRKMQH